MVKLSPSDWVATVSIIWDVGIGVPLILFHMAMIGILNIIAGVVLVAGAAIYEDRHWKSQGKISWLDFMQIRDLMAHGNNYEAAVLTLKKGYNMEEDEMKKLTPERFHELVMNLRTEKQGAS